MVENQAIKTCSSCNLNFLVSWWSNRSKEEALAVKLCASCEINARPEGALAQFVRGSMESIVDELETRLDAAQQDLYKRNGG